LLAAKKLRVFTGRPLMVKNQDDCGSSFNLFMKLIDSAASEQKKHWHCTSMKSCPRQGCFGGIRGYTPYAHQPIFKVAYTHLQKVGARAYAHL
jgi:hypothetical protein